MVELSRNSFERLLNEITSELTNLTISDSNKGLYDSLNKSPHEVFAQKMKQDQYMREVVRSNNKVLQRSSKNRNVHDSLVINSQGTKSERFGTLSENNKIGNKLHRYKSPL